MATRDWSVFYGSFSAIEVAASVRGCVKTPIARLAAKAARYTFPPAGLPPAVLHGVSLTFSPEHDLTHVRSVSGVHPILVVIDSVAAYRDRYAFSCSNSSRTARSLTSGEYRFALSMLQSSQELEPPGKSGRFNLSGSGTNSPK